MYGTTALAELDQADARFSETENEDLVERFLEAVSAGWPQVMSFLESCDLDCEAQEMLRQLEQNA